MIPRLLALLGLILVSDLMAAEPPELEEKALPEIKAAITLPKEWFVKVDKEDDVVVYQFSREKPTETGFVTGLILTVTPKVKERTEMKPSQYGVEMLSAMLEDGAPKIEPVKEGPIESYRATHQIEGENGNVEMINIAKANDATGTLYFLTWQAPVSEEATIKELRETILGSLKLDPAF
jgi:hypothetical protein